MMVFGVRGRSIATNGLHAITLVRATGAVSLGGTALDRSAILGRHDTLRAVEAELVSLCALGMDDGELDRWAEGCRDAIHERHRRLSLLRAEMAVADRSGRDTNVRARIATRIDEIIAVESRGTWA